MTHPAQTFRYRGVLSDWKFEDVPAQHAKLRTIIGGNTGEYYCKQKALSRDFVIESSEHVCRHLRRPIFILTSKGYREVKRQYNPHAREHGLEMLP